MRNDAMRRLGWICGLAGALAVLGWGAACNRSEAPASEAAPVAANAQESEAPAPEEKGAAKSGEGLRGLPAAALPPGDGKPKAKMDESAPLGLVGGAQGAAAPPPAMRAYGTPAGSFEVTAAQPAQAAIDPNGRFATTYRPGGGHLASFEAAISQGIVTGAERELVSDVGARYAPAMEPPTDKALALRADVERAKLAPSGGEVHVRVALRSSTKAPPRPQLSVHLVLDVSGSMRGEPIARARDAALALVERLDDKDDFSLITFSSDANVLIPGGPVGARRAALKKSIAAIEEGGGTNIGGGLTLGYEQASRKGVPEDAMRVVLLLSDGRANAGITARADLSKLALDAFQAGIQTSSFGLGTDYDGELMSDIASDGAGGYYYLRDPEQISPALRTELDKRLDPVATAVELRVRLQPDVELLKVYGSRRLSAMESQRVRAIEVAADKQAEKRDSIKSDRKDDAEGGMRFFIPAFAHDDAHALLVKLRLPAGTGSRKVASIELKYKDRLAKKNVIDELPFTLSYADADAASAATLDPSVARTVQGFLAGETLADAAARISRGDRDGAIATLAERETLLRTASAQLGEPLFLKDAERLARLRSYASSGSSGMGDPLVLAMLLETASRSHLR